MMEAKPQVAIAQEGSCASTSRKVFSAALYQNECSMATPRRNKRLHLGVAGIFERDFAELANGFVVIVRQHNAGREQQKRESSGE